MQRQHVSLKFATTAANTAIGRSTLVVISLAALAGCVDAPGSIDAEPSEFEGDCAGQEPTPGSAHEVCTWRLRSSGENYVVIRVEVGNHSTLNFTYEVLGTWPSSQAYFYHSLVGEPFMREGSATLRVGSAARSSCAPGAPAFMECPVRDWSEAGGGGDGGSIEPGRFSLVTALFGATTAEIDLTIESNRSFVVLDASKGRSDLLLPSPSADDANVSTFEVSSSEPFWLIARNAGGVVLESMHTQAPNGQTSVFARNQTNGNWIPPAHWELDLPLDSPNFVGSPGEWQVDVRWHQVPDRPTGGPILGVLRSPSFLQAP